MSKLRRIRVLLAWCGSVLAILILVIAGIWAMFPPEDKSTYLVEPSLWSGVRITPEYCDLFIVIDRGEGCFPVWMNENAWGRYRSLSALEVDVTRVHGVPCDGHRLWIAASTWWLVIALFQPALWLAAARSRAKWKAARAGRCVHCGYDLRGSERNCPECGAARNIDAIDLAQIDARMWKRRPVFSFLALLSVIAAGVIGFLLFAAIQGHMRVIDVDLPGLVRIKTNGEYWGLNYGNDSYRFPGNTVFGIRVDGYWSNRPGSGSPHVRVDLHALYVLMALVILPLWWCFVQRRDRRRIAARSCRRCWHDMEGAAGPCPKCGTVR